MSLTLQAPPESGGSLEDKAVLLTGPAGAALPPQAAPPEAPNTATERRARLRLRKVSGGRGLSHTTYPPQCYGRGRLVGFRGDRLCLVPLSCASEGGGPWVPSAAPDACVPVRDFQGRPALEPFFPPFLSVQKGGPRRIGERGWRSQKVKPRNEPCASSLPPGGEKA